MGVRGVVNRFLSPLPKVRLLVQEPAGFLPEGGSSSPLQSPHLTCPCPGRTAVGGAGGVLGAGALQEAARAMEEGGDMGWS